MAKKMMINCGICDARNVSEETLKAYERVVINSGTVLVSPESKVLLDVYGVIMNSGNVMEVDKDAKISSTNGSTRINGSDAVTGKTFLLVNGSLEIGPDAREVLKQYVGITVNGTVLYPESLSGCLGQMKVNGSVHIYPDEAIVLKRNAVIDRLFALRAKNKLYWSARRMIMADPQLDGAVLAAKGASFSSKEVILAESKVESMLDLIDEKAEIIIVPDGTSVITDDVELTDLTIKKYGTKLYILGDLKVTREAENALSALEYLNIQGDASVPAVLKDSLMERITQISGKVKVVKDTAIHGKTSLRISKWMLEQAADGLSVDDCVNVTLDADIPGRLILERLSLSDCVNVKCTAEQETAVAAVSEDVVNIGTPGSGEDMGIGDMVKGILSGARELLDTKMVNTGEYVL